MIQTKFFSKKEIIFWQYLLLSFLNKKSNIFWNKINPFGLNFYHREINHRIASKINPFWSVKSQVCLAEKFSFFPEKSFVLSQLLVEFLHWEMFTFGCSWLWHLNEGKWSLVLVSGGKCLYFAADKCSHWCHGFVQLQLWFELGGQWATRRGGQISSVRLLLVCCRCVFFFNFVQKLNQFLLVKFFIFQVRQKVNSSILFVSFGQHC